MNSKMNAKFYKKKKGILYVVSGPSGAGKTTLCRELAEVIPDLAYSVSHTTRKPRNGEIDGEHYYFVTEEEFKQIIRNNGFVEYAVVHGNYYGTAKKELERLFSLGKDVLIDIDTQGTIQIQKAGMGEAFIFILPPSLPELNKRLKIRDANDKKELELRLKNAINEIKCCYIYDYIIENDNITQALEALKSIVIAERSRVRYIDIANVKKQFGIEEE